MNPSQQLKIFLAARLGPLAVGSIVASAFAPRLRLLYFSPTVIPLPWFAGICEYHSHTADMSAAGKPPDIGIRDEVITRVEEKRAIAREEGGPELKGRGIPLAVRFLKLD